MAQYLFMSSVLDRVIGSLRNRPRILAFDFDGTLAPIASSPEDVVIPAELPYLLEKLAEDKGTAVAVASGRSVPDLESMIRVSSIIYIGNHGLTSSAEGFGASEEDIRNWSAEASKIHAGISYLETLYKGCIVENKGPVLSIHFRKVDSKRTEELLEKIKIISDEYNRNIQSGKMVAELKPKTMITKGTALLKLASESVSGWHRGGTFLFAGDDKSDEDGFLAIKELGPGSVSLKIGEGETKADYRLYEGEIVKLIESII